MATTAPTTPQRLPIVGIDLGTTNSLVAVAAWGSDHRARVLADDQGRVLLPSVVRYHITAESGETRASVASVGVEARACAVEFPTTTISSVKRLMGRSRRDAESDLKYLSYHVIEGPNQTARVWLPDTTQRSGVAAGSETPEAVPNSPGVMISPQEVSAVILSSLKQQAERSLGIEVRRAVVTVPAYFDDAQRQATRDAGRLAGLDVVRIVNEPTAAALAYGLGVDVALNASSRVIAVFDLGGGTFDVSILRLTPRAPAPNTPNNDEADAGTGASAFQVLSTAGDTHLGGDDFDHALVKLFTDEINTRWAPPGGTIEFPAEARRALLSFAEQTKIRLSTTEQAEVRIDLGSDAQTESRMYQRTVTRDEYERLIDPLVDRAIAACRRAIRDARRAMDDAGEAISTVVMVGGATRTPLVRRRVAEFFAVEPYTAIDPDTVVALGAAVQGAIMNGGVQDTLLLDVVPLSLGIETVGGAAAKLIVRNAPVPTRASERFSTSVDGQTSIKLHIVQGEREMAADCRSLGVFHLSGIPPMPAGIPKVLVTFTLDANAVLHVTAVEERSGKVARLQVIPNHGLTRDEVNKMESDSFTHAREDMTRHRVVDLIANARLDLHWIRQGIIRVADRISRDYRDELETKIADLEQVVNRAAADWKSVNPDELSAAKDSLDRASVRLHEIAIAESLKGSNTER